MLNKLTKKPTKKPTTPDPLKPCPLCGSDPCDRGYGVSCDGCGLWLGDGTQVGRLGGYLKVWNTRRAAK